MAAGAPFEGQRQNIIDGITSAQAEAAGWNAVVRAGIPVVNVVRGSDTQVTVTLPAFAGYAITADETITVTVPGTAVTGAAPIVAAPTFTIINAAPPLSTNANLSALTLSAGVLAPVFDANTIAYTASVANGVASVDVTATMDHGGATQTVNGVATASGVARNVALAVGANPIPIVVTAEDGVTDKTYTVTVTRAAAAAPAPIFAPQPVQCLPGTFSGTGFTPCTRAPAGSYVAGTGAMSATQCAPGSFSSTTGASSCTLAPLNTYIDTTGATSATACPAGTTTTAPGATSATQCLRPNQVSDVSLTSNNYRAGSTGVWTVEFTTSADGALTAGHDIFLRVEGVNFFGSNVGSVSLGGEFVRPPGWIVTRSILSAVRDTIRFTLRAGEGASLAAGATGRITFTMQNPTARTIPASDITVVTSKDTTPGAATADVIITPKPGPKLSGLFVAPSDVTLATLAAQTITVPLVDGQTAYTVDVPAGKRYGVHGESTGNTVTYYLGSEAVSTRLFDPANKPSGHATGSTVTIRAANAAGAFTDYTVTLRAPVECLNGGTAVDGNCQCLPGFTGAQCQTLIKSKLGFVTQPSGAVAGIVFTTQPRVAIQGVNGARTFDTDTVTLRIKVGTGTPGAALTATAKSAVAGIATFTDVKIDRPGAGYVLVAESGTLTLAESAPFNVTAAASLTGVRFSASPTTPTTATAITVDFTSSAALRNGDTITLGFTGFTPTTGVTASATRGSGFDAGVTFTTSGASSTGITLTLAGTGGLAAGVPASVTVHGYTTPAAGTTAKAGLTVRTTPVASSADVAIGAGLTNVRFTPSSTTADATVTLKVDFTSAVAISTGNAITAGITGFVVPTSGLTVSAASGFSTGSTFSVASTARAINITVTGTAAAGAHLSLTLSGTGLKNPATAGTIARDGLTVRTTQATTPVASSADVAIAGAITNAAVTLSTVTAGATNVEVKVAFVSPVAIPAAGRIEVELPGFVWPAAPVATFRAESPGARANSAAFANGRLTVTLNAGVSIPAGTVTFDVTGATNPAAQAARTDVVIRTTTSAGAVLAETSSGTLPAITSAVRDVRFTAQTTTAGQPTYVSVSFAPSTTLVANDTITIRLSGYTLSGGGLREVILWSKTGKDDDPDHRPTFTVTASDTVVVTHPAGQESDPRSFARLSLLVTNPVAGTIEKAGLTVHTSKDTTPVASATDIVIPGTQVTAATISASPLVANAATTVRVNFRATTALVASDTITVKMAGYTFPVGAVTVRTGTGITGTLTGTVTAGALDTVAITGGSVAAGTQLTLTFPATNPAAGAVSASGLTVHTSKDVTPVASSAGFTITAAILGVNIEGPTTAVARPAGGSLQLTTNVSGLGGATPSYAWTATPAGCSDLVSIMSSSSLNVFVPDDTSVPTCTFTVTVTAGTRTATASHTISFTAGARLEFATQPSDGGSPYAVDVTVRVLNADGTVNETFTGNVTLSARAAGRTFTLGIAAARNGEAPFNRTWTPQVAGATWELIARASGYTAVTSESFTVSAVTATRLVITSVVPTTLTEGEKFTLTVAAQDAAGKTDTGRTDFVNLQADGTVVGTTRVSFVNGVATFSGLSFANASTTRPRGYTITFVSPNSLLTSATTPGIRVTVDNTPTSIGFTRQPGDSTSGVAFTTQPQVMFYNAAGQVVTTATGSVTLTLGKAGGGTTTSTLGGTSSTSAVAGVATFSGMSVTGADRNLVLTATSGTLTATSRPFNVSTGPSTEIKPAVPIRRQFVSKLADLLKIPEDDIVCIGTECVRADTSITQDGNAHGAAEVNQSTGTRTATLAPLIIISELDVDAFVASEGAPPAGMDLLQGLLLEARDDNGIPMDALPAGVQIPLTLTVPAGRIPADTPPGDLLMVEWTGSEWGTARPATVRANADGSFTITTAIGELKLFGVFFAPGAGAITGLTAFSASGVASGVFTGGTVDLLAHAIGLYQAHSAWVQRLEDGAYRTPDPDRPGVPCEALQRRVRQLAVRKHAAVLDAAAARARRSARLTGCGAARDDASVDLDGHDLHGCPRRYALGDRHAIRCPLDAHRRSERHRGTGLPHARRAGADDPPVAGEAVATDRHA